MTDGVTDFLQALKNKSPQNIRFEFANGTVIEKSDISLTSGGVTYTEILNADTDMTIGRAVMSEISAVLVNHDGRFTNFDFTQEFTAKFGVEVDGAFSYVKLGVFRGERPEKVRGRLIEFTAHDRMSLFDKPAADFVKSLTFPKTLEDIYIGLCGFCGVACVLSNLPAFSKVFDSNPLENTDYTCREILAYIAETAGSYARISRNGMVELVWFSSANYTFSRTDRFEMSESEFDVPPIDKLQVYSSFGDQLTTSGTGDVVYVVSDNPFLYIENDTQQGSLKPYADAIFSRISTFPAYKPSSFRAECNPMIKCGDIIKVVDDYDTEIKFPVFMQTITWNGYAKAEYENTGGIARQNAPVEQRELEQIKRKMVQTKDLNTSIDSYLNSQEGVASITQAVSGTFVTEDDLSGYVQSSELDAEIESYINGAEGVASITQSLSGTFVKENELGEYATKTEMSTSISQSISNFESSLTLTASSSSSSSDTSIGTYSDVHGSPGFDLTSDGYYTSSNSGISSSYAYGMWSFSNVSSAKTVTIRCISYGESNYDFGIISKLNTSLAPNNVADTLNVLKSFKGESSANPVDIELNIPAGNSFFTFKYIKYNSGNNGGDYFKIKVIEKGTSGSQKSTLTLKSGSAVLSSADITFDGLVTFESLETLGATVINGGNIATNSITADKLAVGELSVKRVLFDDDQYPFNIVSSELSSGNSRTVIGLAENLNVGFDAAQFLELYGTQIYMSRSGYDLSGGNTNNYSLKFDMVNREILSGSRLWSIGHFVDDTDYTAFGDACFNDLYTGRIYCDGRICMGVLGETYPCLRYYNGELRWYRSSSDYIPLA